MVPCPRRRPLLATLALACAGAGVAGPAHAADTTPPAIQITVPSSPGTGPWIGWYAAPVEVRVSATDDTVVSSLGYQMTGAQNESGFPPPPEFTRTVTQQGTTMLTVKAGDPVGNRAEQVYGIGLDLTKPTVTLGGDATTGRIRRGQVRRLTYICADQHTAVVSCTGRIGDAPFASGDPVPTETNGPRTVTVTAIDAVGHRADRSFSYTVNDPRLQEIEATNIEGRAEGGDPDYLRVGQVVTARPPRFDPAATGVTYRWTDEWDNTIHEGPTFVVRPEHIGRRIRVVAVGTRDGFEPTPSYQPDTVSVAPDLHISGRPSVTTAPLEGSTLRVVAPATVIPSADTTATIWTVGDRTIQAAEITLTGADVGRLIGCEQEYQREEYATARVPCVFPGGATTATVTGHAWTVQKPAAIEGRARVGKKLRVGLPRLSGPAATYAYQWLRNGKPIKGATNATYKAKKVDARRQISVRVTASTPHRPDTLSVSTAKKVRR